MRRSTQREEQSRVKGGGKLVILIPPLGIGQSKSNAMCELLSHTNCCERELEETLTC